MNEDKVNRLIKEEWEKKVENTPSAEDLGIDIESLLNSAYEEVGKKQEEKVRREKKRERKMSGVRKIMAALLTFALIVGALAVFAPDEGYADIFRFMIGRESSADEMVEDNLIGNEVEGEGKIESIMVSEEDLDKEAGFHVLMPYYMPEGYEIEYILLTKGGGYLNEIEMLYNNPITEKLIIYRIIKQEYKRAAGESSDAYGEKKEIIAGDSKYYCYEDAENERMRIFWQDENFSYQIDGDFDAGEAETIIRSLK